MLSVLITLFIFLMVTLGVKIFLIDFILSGLYNAFYFGLFGYKYIKNYTLLKLNGSL